MDQELVETRELITDGEILAVNHLSHNVLLARQWVAVFQDPVIELAHVHYWPSRHLHLAIDFFPLLDREGGEAKRGVLLRLVHFSGSVQLFENGVDGFAFFQALVVRLCAEFCLFPAGLKRNSHPAVFW